MILSPGLERKGTRLAERQVIAQRGRVLGGQSEPGHEFLHLSSSHDCISATLLCAVESTDPLCLCHLLAE